MDRPIQYRCWQYCRAGSYLSYQIRTFAELENGIMCSVSQRVVYANKFCVVNNNPLTKVISFKGFSH